MSEFYRLTLGILGVWRVTHLLHAEDGPWELVAKLRKLAGAGVFGRAMDCFYCLSLWIAAPAALILGQSRLEQGLLWPALSAGAILIERIVERLGTALYEEAQRDAERGTKE
jgi:hypothetical protein